MASIVKKYKIAVSMGALFCLTILKTTNSAILFCCLFFLAALAALLKSRGALNQKIKFSPWQVVTAAIICALLGKLFYESWIVSWRLTWLPSVFPLSYNQCIAFIALCLAVLAFPATVTFVASVSKAVKESFSDYGKIDGYKGKAIPFGKAYTILFALYFTAILAIIRADVKYLDDFDRIRRGVRGWENFSRFLTNGLASFLYTNDYLTDISPLTQILAVAIMTLGALVVLSTVFKRKEFTLWELLATLPLCLNPYFLECLSYKFDAPYMALSVFISVAPCLFIGQSSILYISVSALCTVIMCATYQASSGFFPLIVILLVFRMLNKGEKLKSAAEFAVKSAIGYIIGILYFNCVVMIPVSGIGYVSGSLPPVSSVIPTFCSNLSHYYSLISSDFTPLWKFLSVAIVICFIVAFVMTGKQKNLVFSAICSAAVVVLQGILCFGLYPFLEKPLFYPRAMYGFGFFLMLLSVFAAEYRQNSYLKIPSLILGLSLFTFSFTYGNALALQKEYTQFRQEMVIQDLVNLDLIPTDSSAEPVTVQISKNAGYAPPLYTMIGEYPILNRLVQQSFGESWVWSSYEFYNYYGLKNVVRNTSINLTEYNLPLISENIYQKISGTDQYVLVELKPPY